MQFTCHVALASIWLCLPPPTSLDINGESSLLTTLPACSCRHLCPRPGYLCVWQATATNFRFFGPSLVAQFKAIQAELPAARCPTPASPQTFLSLPHPSFRFPTLPLVLFTAGRKAKQNAGIENCVYVKRGKSEAQRSSVATVGTAPQLPTPHPLEPCSTSPTSPAWPPWSVFGNQQENIQENSLQSTRSSTRSTALLYRPLHPVLLTRIST